MREIEGAKNTMADRTKLTPRGANPKDEPRSRTFFLRWPDGRVERATGSTPAAAALSLGYGFDDFRDLTWEEQTT